MVATHFEVAVSLVITRHPDLIIYNRSSQGQKDAELINILQDQISGRTPLILYRSLKLPSPRFLPWRLNLIMDYNDWGSLSLSADLPAIHLTAKRRYLREDWKSDSKLKGTIEASDAIAR